MMIAATNSKLGEQHLLLGLSRHNINKLIEGKPILISRKSHGDAVPDGMTIAIMFGETEADMEKELRQHGMIGLKTEVNIDPKLKGHIEG